MWGKLLVFLVALQDSWWGVSSRWTEKSRNRSTGIKTARRSVGIFAKNSTPILSIVRSIYIGTCGYWINYIACTFYWNSRWGCNEGAKKSGDFVCRCIRYLHLSNRWVRPSKLRAAAKLTAKKFQCLWMSRPDVRYLVLLSEVLAYFGEFQCVYQHLSLT